MKLTLAKYTTVLGMGLSALHYGANGYVEAEAKVKASLDGQYRAKVATLAQSLGYGPKEASARRWQDIAGEQAFARKLNPCLVQAVIQVESQGGMQLISRAGAAGHMQLMRDTAKHECGLKTDAERLDPESNIWCGTKLLDRLVKTYGLVKGLQVYNAGPARVGKTEENRQYPGKVLNALARCTVQS